MNIKSGQPHDDPKLYECPSICKNYTVVDMIDHEFPLLDGCDLRFATIDTVSGLQVMGPQCPILTGECTSGQCGWKPAAR